MLGQLLRTKLEPRVEDWVARGRGVGQRRVATEAGSEGVEGGISPTELKELWTWAPVEANMEARRRNWGGDYTLEEKEAGLNNLVTGLQRPLEESEDEEDEEDEEEDENEIGGGIVGAHRKPGSSGLEFDISKEGSNPPPRAAPPALPLDDVFRYMMTGTPSRSR